MDCNYFDGEHTYRDYFRDNPEEFVSWCIPYVKDNNAVAVNDIENDEISAIMIDGVDIDFREDKDAIKRLAQTLNPDYAEYRGYSDTYMAVEVMERVGCASCPWFDVCDLMYETMR